MTPRKSGLGKGLDALIPIDEVEPPAGAQGVIQVPLSSITPNPHQPRSPMHEDDLIGLANSIQEHGVIQPLVVRRSADGFELIAGERRWRAALKAGLEEVPVVIKDVSDDQVLMLSLVENLQRENLNPLEEAEAYRRLIEELGFSQENVGEFVGKDRSTITNTLRLSKLPEKIKEDERYIHYQFKMQLLEAFTLSR